MDKHARVNVYAEDALYVYAYLEDFKHDVKEWKIAVYEIFRYQMTWHFAHTIELYDSRENGVFLQIVCKPKYEKSLIGTMEELGFCNIRVDHQEIGAIECSDLPEDFLIDFAIVDY